MNLVTLYGAALLLLALLIASPALDPITNFAWGVRRPKRGPWRYLLLEFARSEAGYTTTYCWPGGASGPSTTAPTAIQASQVNMQTGLVAIGDAETFAFFTHNWGLGASSPTFLFPVIMYRQSDVGTGPSTQLGTLTFTISNTNVVGIGKVAGVGNGGTFIVTLLKPTSLIK